MAQRKAKKKTDRSRREKSPGPVSGALSRQLEHIEDLVDAGKLLEARRELTEACRKYPNRPEPHSWLVHVCQKLDAPDDVQHACEKLLRLTPDDRDATLLWAGSSLAAGHPAAARRAFLRLLAQWPDDPMAEKFRDELQLIEKQIRSYLESYGLPDAKMWELADQHEQVLTLVARFQPQQAREVAEKLLTQQPDFIPGWNNLSLARFYLGDLAGSIAACQRVLSLDEGNLQALSNLIRCLSLAGRRDEALALAGRLKMATSDNPDRYAKKAEALTILCDDEGMLEVLEEAEACHEINDRDRAFVLHYAAVAVLHQGDDRRAESLWRRSLKLYPALRLAQQNLDDLAAPEVEREGPWAFSLTMLCPHAWLDRLQPAHARRGRDAQAHFSRMLEQNAELIVAAPVMLEVGDPALLDLYVNLATASKHAGLLEALKEFALGQRGPYASRMRALSVVSENGLLPPGNVRMWHNGEWREQTLLAFEISGEGGTPHSPAVAELVEKARSAMERGDQEWAERLWREALELEPDKPDLWNNLATAVRHQERTDEANRLLDQVLKQHPDYLFARVNGAHRLVEEQKYDEAHEMLKPLFQRRHLSGPEFIALAGAWINLLVSEGKPEGAVPWLAMWERVSPRDPRLPFWRRQVPQSKGKQSKRFEVREV